MVYATRDLSRRQFWKPSPVRAKRLSFQRGDKGARTSFRCKVFWKWRTAAALPCGQPCDAPWSAASTSTKLSPLSKARIGYVLTRWALSECELYLCVCV